MNRFGLLLLFIFCFIFDSSAQLSIDSLERDLNSYLTLDTHRVNMLSNLGFEYWIVDPNRSELYGKQALELSKILEFEKGIAYAHRIIGVGQWARGNYDPALKNLFLALQKYERLSDTLGQANSRLNIGVVYGDQKNYERAFEELKLAQGLFEKQNQQGRIATTYTKIGTLLAEQEKYDEAYEHYIASLEIHEEASFTYGITEVNNRLGILFQNKKEYEKSLSYLFRSLESGQGNNDQYGVADNYTQIGMVYAFKNDDQQAKQYLFKGLEIADRLGIKATRRDIYLALKNLAVRKGNTQEALMYFEKFVSEKDSLFNEEMVTRIAHMETAHAMSQKEREFKIQQQDIKLLEQKNALGKMTRTGLIIGIALLSLLGYVFFRLQKLRMKAKTVLFEKEQKLKQQEISLAEFQVRQAELKNEELIGELDSRNKELTSYTLNFIRKNELLDEVKKMVIDLKIESKGTRMNANLHALQKKLQTATSFDQDWDNFRWHFEKVHQGFFNKLFEKFPDLSNNDLKLCALIYMNLSIKEMSTILGISPDSVKTARSRLRKKLQMDRETGILEFLMKV